MRVSEFELAVGCEDHTLRWNRRSQEGEVGVQKELRHTVTSTSFNNLRWNLIAYCEKNRAGFRLSFGMKPWRRWHLVHGQEQPRWLKQSNSFVQYFVFAGFDFVLFFLTMYRSGRWIIRKVNFFSSGLRNGNIAICPMNTDPETFKFRPGHKGRVLDVSFSPDG